MIKSRVCEILGIEYPIFQGGMAWVADAELAAAVSNAGGLGLISAINAGTEAVRNEIRKCRNDIKAFKGYDYFAWRAVFASESIHAY